MTTSSGEPLRSHEIFLFNEFFESGLEESVSPFLKPGSRSWGKNLALKASLLAALILAASFSLSFSPSLLPLSSLLLIITYFLAGIPSLINALEDIISLEINIDVLMTLAAFLSVLIGSGMEGALLLVLFSFSGAMEHAVSSKARGALHNLNRLAPPMACVVGKQGTLYEQSVRDIAIGTHILVKAGEVVPLDGKVFEGISSVNLVHLTGENLPVTKKVGDQVAAGTRNLEGALTLEVTHTSSESTLARIIRLVTFAQESRPKFQRWLDKVSKGYAITIILLAFSLALLIPLFSHVPYQGFEGSIYRSLAFLIAASPCALILALPIAYLSAISTCARRGILLKGGITLDRLAACSIVAFDKTGTLTTGELHCTSVESLNPQTTVSQDTALAIASALERNAVHPIAKAILAYTQERKISPFPLKDFKAIPGYGLEGIVHLPEGAFSAYIGHPIYISQKLSPDQESLLNKHAEVIQKEGHLLSVLLIKDQLMLFRFRDTLRPKIKGTLSHLKQDNNLRLLMLTGDHHNSAKAIATELGVDEFYADLRPEDKLSYVTRLSKEEGLAMVGDGINDAPALARATVGIAMGVVGSGAAIDASDVVLLHDNLDLLDWLMKHAHRTKVIIRQNIFFASAAIVIATLPALLGFVPLWLAVILHEGGTVVVGLNSLRLLRTSLSKIN